MAKNKLKLLAPAISLLGASLLSPVAMAANPENYGIVYDGGVELGVNNTVEAPELVEALQPIMKHRDVTITVSNSTRWKKGYLKEAENKCLPVNYIRVADDSPIAESDNVSFTIAKDGYTAKVDIKSITTDLANDRKTTVGVLDDADFVYAGWQIYTTAECDNEHIADDFSTNFGIRPVENDRVFVRMNVKLLKDNKPFVHNGIFFGITDIDAAQSYKILNEDNILTADNMFVKSKSDLQDPDNAYSLKNMFVANGNYIYSQYNSENGATLGSPEKSNIYVPLLETTQTNGLDLVFGFASGAASGIEYYTYQYNVTYESDENGTISGIEDEKIFPSENPSGSETKPNDGYELTYWTADKDVELSDGTIIEEGDPITDEQITEVVVTSDITFTAHHEKSVKVPDTGANSTNDDSGAKVISASIAGIALIVSVAFVLAHLNRKKVNFKN